MYFHFLEALNNAFEVQFFSGLNFYSLSETLIACTAMQLRFLKEEILLNNAFNWKVLKTRTFQKFLLMSEAAEISWRSNVLANEWSCTVGALWGSGSCSRLVTRGSWVRIPLGAYALRQGILSTIVSLDPGVVNGYPAGIYSFKCTVHH